MRYPAKAPLPPPLPPERRTVGQLIAEAIKLYMERFWRAVPLGLAAIPFVLAQDRLATGEHGVPTGAHVALLVAIQAPALAAAYVGASLLVVGSAPTARVVQAFVLATLIFAGARLLAMLVILPGVAWFALVGLAVPALLAGETSVRAAVRRGVELARTDFAHQLGGLCGLVLATVVAGLALAFLLHSQADNGDLAATMLADIVLFPIVFLGSALLYVDQEARLRVRGEAVPA